MADSDVPRSPRRRKTAAATVPLPSPIPAPTGLPSNPEVELRIAVLQLHGALSTLISPATIVTLRATPPMTRWFHIFQLPAMVLFSMVTALVCGVGFIYSTLPVVARQRLKTSVEAGASILGLRSSNTFSAGNAGLPVAANHPQPPATLNPPNEPPALPNAAAPVAPGTPPPATPAPNPANQ